MAKISIVNRQNLQSGQGVSAQNTAVTPVSVIGGKVAKIGEEFEKKAHQSFVSNEVTSRYADYIKSDSDYTGARSADVNGFKTLHADWKKNSVELRNNAFKDLTDPDAQRILGEKILNYSTRQGISVQSHARKQGVSSARAKTVASLETLKEQAIVAKNSDLPEIMETMRVNLALQADAGIYTKEQVDILLKNVNGDVQESRMQHLIRNNPGGALEILKKSKSIPGLTAGRQLQLMRIAKSMVRQNKAVATQEIRQLQNDDLLSLKRFGKGVPNMHDKILRLEGKGAASKYKKKQDLALKIYDGNTAIANFSKQEINSFLKTEIAKIKPGAGVSQQAALVQEYAKTARERIKLLDTDIVKAINQSLLIKKTPKEAEEDKKDPVKDNPLLNALTSFDKDFSTSIGLKAKQAIKNEKILAVQRSSNIGPEKLSLLENDEAKGLVTIYQNTAAKNKGKFFAQLRSGYTKDHYRIVFRDMVKNKLPVEAIVMNSFKDNPNGVQLSMDLSRAIELGPKLAKDVPILDKNDMRTEIDTATNEYFNSVTKYNQSALTIPYIKDVKSAIEKIALVKMQVHGMSARDAGKQAADEVINSRYNFHQKTSLIGSTRSPDVGQGKFEFVQRIDIRVPKEYNVNTVVAFSAFTFANLADKKFNINPGLSVPLAGMPIAKRRKLYIDFLKEYGTWVTNSNDDGLIMIDNNQQPVVDMDGKKFGFKFDEMNFTGK